MPASIRRRREELVLQVQQADDVAAVFAAASPRLRGIVPFDAAAWMLTDPGTGLLTAPTRVENVDHEPEICSRIARREFFGEDVNLFHDLARAEVPAAAWRASLSDPRQSARYWDHRLLGIHDELRAVLRVGDSPWGVVVLWRYQGGTPFTKQEAGLVASLSAPLGEALRVRARPTPALDGLVGHSQPGLLLFDRDSTLISANEQARAWLAELPPCELYSPTDLGITVPIWLMSMVFRASAARRGFGDGTARARVRTVRGRWLVCHASCLEEASGSREQIAVVIEPATATAVAPIIVQAYDLSEREQQITRLIARGASTAEMADELFLSTHTIREYIKTIFHKVEVSSRGELVAKLFAEHYWPVHADDVVHV